MKKLRVSRFFIRFFISFCMGGTFVSMWLWDPSVAAIITGGLCFGWIGAGFGE